MNAKYFFKRVCFVMLSAALVFALTACAGTGGKFGAGSDILLSDLMTDSEYCYKEIQWGMSVDEVKEALSYKIVEDTALGEPPKGYEFFRSKSGLKLDGQTGTSSFEFQNGQLAVMKYDFRLDNNYEEWFDTQINTLTDLYGAETEKSNGGNDELQSTVYKWETDNTVLNAILITRKLKKPIASIGVYTKRKKAK